MACARLLLLLRPCSRAQFMNVLRFIPFLRVCVCVYLNPSGQVYKRIGMRLWPFVNDRPSKSHSTSLASLRPLPAFCLSPIPPPRPLDLSEEKPADNDRAGGSTGMFLVFSFCPIQPHSVGLILLSLCCVHEFLFYLPFPHFPLFSSLSA